MVWWVAILPPLSWEQLLGQNMLVEIGLSHCLIQYHYLLFTPDIKVTAWKSAGLYT